MSTITRNPAMPAPDDDPQTTRGHDDTSALDEATVRRVMNGLRARSAFETPLLQVKARLTESAQPRLARCWVLRAIQAGSAVALCTILQFCVWAPEADAEASAVSSLASRKSDMEAGFCVDEVPANPNGHALALRTKAHSLAQAPMLAQTVWSRKPDTDALRLLSVLANQGVTAELRPQGNDRIVRAVLPSAALEHLVQAMADKGLVTPSSGLLVVRFVVPAS